MRYNPRTPQPPRAGGGERTIPHADAIAVRDVSKRYPTRDGSVAALEGISFGAYADFMLKTGIIKQAVTVPELITNELIDEINRFDPEKTAAEARAYRAGG